MNQLILDILIQTMIFSVLAMGVMLSYKILDIPDLTVDGSLPLGGVVMAVLSISGMNPWIALLLSFIAGVLAGTVTCLLQTKLHIKPLLSGILVMTGLYSINLVIGTGRPNIPLFTSITPFDMVTLSSNDQINTFLILLIIVLALTIIIELLLSTNLGYLMKTVGDNEGMVENLGHDLDLVKTIGLALANGLVALSGALLVSVNRYYDITLGTGVLVLGLSSVIIGGSVFSKMKFFVGKVIMGTLVYRLIIGLAIYIGVNPQLMKLMTVMIFVVALTLNHRKLDEKNR